MSRQTSVSTQSIVCTGPIDETATTILEPFGQIVMAADGQEQTLLQLAEHAVALVVRGEGVVTAKVIETASQLKVIGRSGSGYNNVDIAAATARRIPTQVRLSARDIDRRDAPRHQSGPS